MDYQDILYEVDDPVATVTLNRPDKLNAMTLRTILELHHVMVEAENDPAVVGIVLTGAGRGFCAGLDMSALEAMQQAGTTKVSAVLPELAGFEIEATRSLGLWVTRLPCPVSLSHWVLFVAVKDGNPDG